MIKRLFQGSYLMLCFSLLCMPAFLISCENDKAEVERLTTADNEPLEKISQLETLYSDSGLVRVRVTAKELIKKTGTQPITEMPKGLNVDFFNPQLEVISRLSAHYAIYYEVDRVWEAQRDVVVINEKGEKLNTEKLIWDERSGLIRSDQFVKISTPKEIIYGQGFEADQSFNKYRIFNVKGRITVNE